MRPRGGVIGVNPLSSGTWTLRDAEAMNRDGKSPFMSDTLYSSVIMQLPMNGPAGSSTFIDTSTSPISLSATGATIQTAQSKSGGSSGLFGSFKYLSFSSGPLNFSSGQDFCIELWAYPTTQTASFRTVFSNYQTYSSGSCALFAGISGVDTTVWMFMFGGTYPPALRSTSAIAANKWTHLAISRNSGTIALYVNGIAEATITNNNASVGSGALSYIATAGDNLTGTYFEGFIDDFRITKNNSRYTKTFSQVAPLFAQ